MQTASLWIYIFSYLFNARRATPEKKCQKIGANKRVLPKIPLRKKGVAKGQAKLQRQKGGSKK